MKKRVKIYVLLILSTVLIIVLSIQVKNYIGELIHTDVTSIKKARKRFRPNSDINFKHIDVKYNFIAPSGVVPIKHDIKTPNVDSRGSTGLDGMTWDEIAAFRLEKIKTYKQLNFYHPQYHPFKFNHQRIYRLITPGEKWLGPTPYYVANPYLLIVLTCANHVTPLNLYCPDVSTVYDNGTIIETRTGRSAVCWFGYVFNSRDYPGKVWPIMVNAWDAGFFYIHVDISKSLNIKGSDNPNHITNKFHTRLYIYHVGKYKKNNISPTVRNAWLTLKKKDTETKIHIKLWRTPPRSLHKLPALTYIFHIIP